MSIIIKFIFKNIWEKRLRTLLVLFSICLSTALLFSSLGISDNIAQVYMKQIRGQIGEAEFVIHAGRDSSSRYFIPLRIGSLQHELAYAAGVLQESAAYKISSREQAPVGLVGYKLEDLQKMNPPELQEEYGLYPFNGNKVIISRLAAEEYGLKAGDHLDVKIRDNIHRFSIAAIAAPRGVFAPGMESFNAVVPLETLSLIVGERGKVSRLYIKTKDSQDLGRVEAELKKSFPRCEINRTITDGELQEYTRVIRTPFMLMLLLVVSISIFVIYTAFKVISFERMPIMGTFRSIGATQKGINLLLLSESLAYGVIGGLLGCLLGIGLLYGMTYTMALDPWDPNPASAGQIELYYSYLYIALSFISAVLLSLGSSLLPIIRTNKIPLRDIILNNYDRQQQIKTSRTKAALALLILSLVIPRLVPDQAAAVLGPLSIITVTMAVIWLIPHIMDLFVVFYERCLPLVFGHEGILAAKNIYSNKDMRNNIILLTIGLASLLLINTISFSVSREVMNVYDDFQTDIMAFIEDGDRNTENTLRAAKGVESVMGIYETGQIETAESAEKINTIWGVDGSRISDFIDFQLQGDEEEILKKFASGRTIIPSTFLKRKMKLQEGDFITLKTARGNREYQVVGFSNTLLNNGSIVLIPDKYMKSDWKFKYYSTFWIKTSSEPAGVSQTLRNKLLQRNLFCITMEEMEENNAKANNQLFYLLQGFSLITMLIGVFGVFNNIVVSLLARKRSLAIFRSMGMSQRQMIKVLLAEALSVGMIAGFTAAATGLVYLLQTGQLLYLLDLPIRIHYPFRYFLVTFWAGAAISVLATLLPSRQTARLDIVRELKYE